MQQHDSSLALDFRRSPWRPWRRALRSRLVDGTRPPSNLPIANAVTQAFADSSGGRPGRQPVPDDHVRGLVMTGQVVEGDYLRLDRLAAKLDMSVTPVREGLLTLQGEGFVELVPRRGFAVRAISSQDIEDIFWVQAQIEGEVARRAAENFGTRGVENLQVIQEALQKAAAAGDHELVERLNYDFHHAIARVVDSSRLRWFLKQAAQLSPAASSPTWRDGPRPPSTITAPSSPPSPQAMLRLLPRR